MSERKIQKLLAGLDSEEVKEFGNVIAAAGKPRLFRLWELLADAGGNGKIPDKSDLYRAVFDAPYEKQYDYRLRNEVRLLREALFKFLSEKAALEELEARQGRRTWYLLKALLARGAYREYEFQFRNALSAARDRRDHAMVAELGAQYFYYAMRTREMKPEVLRELWALMEGGKQHADWQHQTETARLDQWAAVLGQIAELKGIREEFVRASGATPEDPRAAFFNAFARAVESHGDEQVHWAQRAHAAILPISDHFPQHLVDALAMRAGAAYALGDYTTAREHYEEAAAYAARQKLPLRPDVRFNYCSTLLHAGAYREAVTEIEALWPEIDAQARMRFRLQCLHMFGYIFLGEPEKVRALAPKHIQKRARSEYHYFRFIFCILPYLRGDFEDGIREASNFVHYFNRQGEDAALAWEKEIAVAFKHFYTAVSDDRYPAQRAEKLLALRAQMEDFMQRYPQYRDYLYIMWLIEKIDGLL